MFKLLKKISRLPRAFWGAVEGLLDLMDTRDPVGDAKRAYDRGILAGGRPIQVTWVSNDEEGPLFLVSYRDDGAVRMVLLRDTGKDLIIDGGGLPLQRIQSLFLSYLEDAITDLDTDPEKHRVYCEEFGCPDGEHCTICRGGPHDGYFKCRDCGVVGHVSGKLHGSPKVDLCFPCWRKRKWQEEEVAEKRPNKYAIRIITTPFNTREEAESFRANSNGPIEGLELFPFEEKGGKQFLLAEWLEHRRGKGALVGAEEEVRRLQRELDEANAEVSRLKRSALRPYPILADPPLYVPWGLVETAEEVCKKNHGQSPAHLAERGGLTWKELASVLTGQSLRDTRLMAQEHAKETIQRCVREYFITRPVQSGDLPHTTTAINALIQACNHQELGELILPRRAGPWYSERVLWSSGGLNRTGWRFGRKAYDYSERDYTGDPICAVTEEADGRFSVQVLEQHIGTWPSEQEARDSADKKLAEEHVVLSER